MKGAGKDRKCLLVEIEPPKFANVYTDRGGHWNAKFRPDACTLMGLVSEYEKIGDRWNDLDLFDRSTCRNEVIAMVVRDRDDVSGVFQLDPFHPVGEQVPKSVPFPYSTFEHIRRVRLKGLDDIGRSSEQVHDLRDRSCHGGLGEDQVDLPLSIQMEDQTNGRQKK